jgi:hypothetical protein
MHLRQWTQIPAHKSNTNERWASEKQGAAGDGRTSSSDMSKKRTSHQPVPRTIFGANGLCDGVASYVLRFPCLRSTCVTCFVTQKCPPAHHNLPVSFVCVPVALVYVQLATLLHFVAALQSWPRWRTMTCGGGSRSFVSPLSSLLLASSMLLPAMAPNICVCIGVGDALAAAARCGQLLTTQRCDRALVVMCCYARRGAQRRCSRCTRLQARGSMCCWRWASPGWGTRSVACTRRRARGLSWRTCPHTCPPRPGSLRLIRQLWCGWSARQRRQVQYTATCCGV